MKLEGKVALVTGSARGIGRAIALRLARTGADLVISDINLRSSREVGEKLTADSVMDEVRVLGRRSIGIETDATNKASVNSMASSILQEFGHIDILVNVVGGNQGKKGPVMGDSWTCSEEDMRVILDRNLTATIFCCQAVVPSMVAQKTGAIVNIASGAGLTYPGKVLPFAGLSIYGPAKAGVIQYTRLLAAELGRHGIRVNCVSPGAIVTGRTKGFHNQMPGYTVAESAFLENIALRRKGEPEDIAKAVEFLCTDMSDYITGQIIRVDGGLTLF